MNTIVTTCTDKIIALHDELMAMARMSLDKAIEIGGLLTKRIDKLTFFPELP